MSIYQNIRVSLQLKTENMEEIKKQRGGKREGAGRKAVGLSTTAMSLKLDNELYAVLNSHGLNKNRYINNAVRVAMEKDGYLAGI